jgi:hypothetical protein
MKTERFSYALENVAVLNSEIVGLASEKTHLNW